MLNTNLRPWINRRRNSSAANPSKKLFIAMMAFLIVGFGAHAQQIVIQIFELYSTNGILQAILICNW